MESALALIVLMTVIFMVIGMAFSGNRRYGRPGDYYNPYFDDYQAPPPVIMVQPAIPMPYGRGRDPIGAIVAILICMFLVYLLGRSASPEKQKMPEHTYPVERTGMEYYNQTSGQTEQDQVGYASESTDHIAPVRVPESAIPQSSRAGAVRSVLAITLRRYTSLENAEKLLAQYPKRGIEVLKYGEQDYLACIIFGDDRASADEMMTDLQRPHNRRDLNRFGIFPELQTLQIQSFNVKITP